MTTENERRLRAQLRAAKRPGPLQSRLTKVVQTGLVPYAAALGIGYISEQNEEKGALAILGATAGGLAGQAILNPARDSIADILLAGLAAAGASQFGIEHGRVVCRMQQARKAIAQQKAEDAAKPALDADTREEADVVEINTAQEVTA
jgi:hypothetical protein